MPPQIAANRSSSRLPLSTLQNCHAYVACLEPQQDACRQANSVTSCASLSTYLLSADYISHFVSEVGSGRGLCGVGEKPRRMSASLKWNNVAPKIVGSIGRFPSRNSIHATCSILAARKVGILHRSPLLNPVADDSPPPPPPGAWSPAPPPLSNLAVLGSNVGYHDCAYVRHLATKSPPLVDLILGWFTWLLRLTSAPAYASTRAASKWR